MMLLFLCCFFYAAFLMLLMIVEQSVFNAKSPANFSRGGNLSLFFSIEGK